MLRGEMSSSPEMRDHEKRDSSGLARELIHLRG